MDKEVNYSYKAGVKEAVVFVFHQNDKVLIEHRPCENSGTYNNIFFTTGSIEMKDHEGIEDYKIAALKREISEEFDQNVIPKSFVYLGEVDVTAINFIFYVYLISEWKGQMPNYTIEEGKKFSDLEWIKLSDKSKYFKYDSAFLICDMIENHLTQTNHTEIHQSSLD
jgi:hypothetical protein